MGKFLPLSIRFWKLGITNKSRVKSLAKIILKNTIFEFDKKTFKQKRGTNIRTKFTPLYTILFMAGLEEKILETFEKNPMIWWRYIEDKHFIREHGEESLKAFIDQASIIHPTINLSGPKHKIYRCGT